MIERGFTLIGLMVILVLVGILAAYATIRGAPDYTAYAAKEELIEALRLAQQRSMETTAQPNAGIQIDADGFTFINLSPLSGGWKIRKPGPEVAVNISPSGSITFSGRGVPTCTGALSCSTNSQTITVSANGETTSLVIQPYTGLVHQ